MKDYVFSKQPVRMIVPSVVGSNIDVQARLVTETAQSFLGCPIKIENRPGNGTVTGVAEALSAPADGCTLVFLIIPSIAIQPYLHGVPYTYEDLVPVATVSETYIMLYSNIDSSWSTLGDFIGYAKRKKATIGCSGMGLLPHLAGIELARNARADFSFIQYESSGDAVGALKKNKLDAALALSSVHSRSVRALAIFEPDRKPSLPHVPTAKEQGYDVIGFVRDGVAVKKGTPQNAVAALETAFRKTLGTEEIRSAFVERKTEIKYLGSDDTMKLWVSAVETYRSVVGDLKQG
jgi:tripartite-type tricarboxylate transporter receptor subunit TctC